MARKTQENVEIRPMERMVTSVTVIGDSPLIVHAWSAKAKREMLEKQMGWTAAKKREAKSPLDDFVSSAYWLDPMPDPITYESVNDVLSDGARFGFPAGAFKDASISAAYRMGFAQDKVSIMGIMKVLPDATGYYGGELRADMTRKKIDIIPNQFLSLDLVQISSDPPIMREDMVKIQKTTDIRYRAQFNNWKAVLRIEYNASGKYSFSDIINFIDYGGTCCGIGEWRAEKGGNYGTYHVECQG